MRIERGAPGRLGAHWDGRGVAVTVRAPDATRVELCVFDPHDALRETARLVLPGRSGPLHHGYVPGLLPGTPYGLRAHGPHSPLKGQRFNPHKLLVDPYARCLHGTLRWTEATRTGSSGGAPCPRDSAPDVPRAVVWHDDFDWHGQRPLRTPLRDTVIAELHVKGATIAHPDVPAALRGRYGGLAHPAFIAHLKRLGVTAVELLPVCEFIDDAELVQRGLVNYWGYMPLALLAPAQRYAHGTQPGAAVLELKEAIRGLHAAGIEVLLDVVYNHTCERGDDGPTLSLRGLDHAGYYRLTSTHARRHDDTGCGNTLDLSRAAAHHLVLESLRHWVRDYRADGFRFDLASVLGRGADNRFSPDASFFHAVAADPELSQVKLIAEPWDLGHDGYQLGAYPHPFAEWNDRFRDALRGFWRGDLDRQRELAVRLAGSPDLYAANRRGPVASINYVTCHDGSTLHDLVTYAQKRNHDNGEENRDGAAHELAFNHGVEGESEDAAVLTAREQTQRALLGCLLLARGTPMLLLGDELDRSQRGNNNAYCQDNPLSWLDYGDAPKRARLSAWIAELTALRREQAALFCESFDDVDGESPVSFDAHGAATTEGSPGDGCFGVLLRAAATGEPSLYLTLNASEHARVLHLPPVLDATSAELLLDSALAPACAQLARGVLQLPARSMAVVRASRPAH